MDAYINAVKSNDLVKAKKAFGPIMLERTAALIENRRKELAAAIMIEGEEKEEDFDDEDEKAEAKKSKESEIEASRKNSGKKIDSKKPNENERTA